MIAEKLLAKALATYVPRGSLTVTDENGRVFTTGDGTAPRVRMTFHGTGTTWAIMRDPELTLGEAYMDGRLTLEEGTIYDFLQLILQDSRGDRGKLPIPTVSMLREVAFKLARGNDPSSARQNVSHHYDLSGQLYDLFLDRHRQYSCAYFEHPGQGLDDAQRAKQRHVAAKLFVEPGQSVLDIGSGWGGLSAYLAEYAGAGRVKGITLSEEQLAASRRLAAQRGLSSRLSFELEDYRAVQGSFDRIVSVGMFEHVGPKDYRAYFDTAARLLDADGVMLLHTIGRTGKPGYTNPWIRKYIFPGGHMPTLSEMMPAIETAGLAVTDVEVLRIHYAETLRLWRERFMARRNEAVRLYDERFCRMWECYLAMSEAAFRFEDLVVFQIQITKRNYVLPLTRGYIAEREDALRAAETGMAGQQAAG